VLSRFWGSTPQRPTSRREAEHAFFGDQLFSQIVPTVSPPYNLIPKTPSLTKLT